MRVPSEITSLNNDDLELVPGDRGRLDRVNVRGWAAHFDKTDKHPGRPYLVVAPFTNGDRVYVVPGTHTCKRDRADWVELEMVGYPHSMSWFSLLHPGDTDSRHFRAKRADIRYGSKIIAEQLLVQIRELLAEARDEQTNQASRRLYDLAQCVAPLERVIQEWPR